MNYSCTGSVDRTGDAQVGHATSCKSLTLDHRSADIEPRHAPETLFNASLTKIPAGAAGADGSVVYTEGQKAFSQVHPAPSA